MIGIVSAVHWQMNMGLMSVGTCSIVLVLGMTDMTQENVMNSLPDVVRVVIKLELKLFSTSARSTGLLSKIRFG